MECYYIFDLCCNMLLVTFTHLLHCLSISIHHVCHCIADQCIVIDDVSNRAPMWFDVFPTPYSWVFGVATSGLVLQWTVYALTPSKLRDQPHWQTNFKGFWSQVTFFNIIVLVSMGFLILFYRWARVRMLFLLTYFLINGYPLSE
jgi:hypothetical protein